MAGNDITELKRAYEVLGIPFSAPAPSIKKSYRRIAKRWHPDLYPSGTPSHIEATRMMKLINEAYSLVEHAPLRNHIETYPPSLKSTQATHNSDKERKTADWQTLPQNDRFGFWTRFVCGAILGGLVGLRLLLIFSFDRPVLLLVVTGGLVLGFGLGSARYGDRFEHAILDR